MHLYGQKSSPFRKIIILFIFFSLPSLILAQTSGITIQENNIPLKQAFEEIEKQSGYTFAYNRSKLDISQSVSLSVENKPIETVLTKVLKSIGYDYKINGNHIVLSPAEKKSTVSKKTLPVTVQPADIVKDTTVVIIPQNQEVQKVPEEESKDTIVIQPDKTLDELLQNSSIAPSGPYSPTWVVKTNLLYDAMTTINIGMDFRVSKRHTLGLTLNYNPWTFSDNKKFKILHFQPEFRYWICEPFNKHFLGVHADYARFNIGNIKMPLGFYPELEDHRFQGNLFGGGITYGYQWYLASRLSLEATIGLGYYYTDFKKYDCGKCGKYIETGNKHYIGPTKIGISLVYMIK